MAKTIENKIVDLLNNNSMTYGELIMLVLSTPCKEGFTYDVLKKIGRVDLVIGTDKLQKEFVFEDADYDFIKDKITAMVWGSYHIEFINFTDYISSVK